MLDKFSIHTKLEQIYIITDEMNLSFKPFECDEEKMKEKLKAIYKEIPSLNNFIKIINGTNFLDLETLNIFEKKEKEIQREKKWNQEFKKLNKERLSTIFKCLGFNIIYCPQIAENIINELNVLLSIKYENVESTDCLKTSVVLRQSLFYDLAKYVIHNLTGTKCTIKKYFNLSCLITSKQIYNIFFQIKPFR
jgi:hypothetical protein